MGIGRWTVGCPRAVGRLDECGMQSSGFRDPGSSKEPVEPKDAGKVKMTQPTDPQQDYDAGEPPYLPCRDGKVFRFGSAEQLKFESM